VITLQRLRSYNPDPKENLRQLRALEDNAASAVKKLDGSFLPVFAVTRREVTCRASVGEHVVANTVSQDITITFPAATAENAGRCIAVKEIGGAFTCTVTVVSGTVNSAVSYLLGTLGRLYLFCSDGSDWGVTG